MVVAHKNIDAIIENIFIDRIGLGIKAALWAIFIIVFVILSGLALCNGIKEFPWFMFLVILPIVEFLSLTYCYIDYKMSIKYNQRLFSYVKSYKTLVGVYRYKCKLKNVLQYSKIYGVKDQL